MLRAWVTDRKWRARLRAHGWLAKTGRANSQGLEGLTPRSQLCKARLVCKQIQRCLRLKVMVRAARSRVELLLFTVLLLLPPPEDI
jgi:hypothetical protein